jgi:hypothetical protein
MNFAQPCFVKPCATHAPHLRHLCATSEAPLRYPRLQTLRQCATCATYFIGGRVVVEQVAVLELINLDPKTRIDLLKASKLKPL